MIPYIYSVWGKAHIHPQPQCRVPSHQSKCGSLQYKYYNIMPQYSRGLQSAKHCTVLPCPNHNNEIFGVSCCFFRVWARCYTSVGEVQSWTDPVWTGPHPTVSVQVWDFPKNTRPETAWSPVWAFPYCLRLSQTRSGLGPHNLYKQYANILFLIH